MYNEDDGDSDPSYIQLARFIASDPVNIHGRRVREQSSLMALDGSVTMSDVAHDLDGEKKHIAKRAAKPVAKTYSNETIRAMMKDVQHSRWHCGWCNARELLATDDMLACQQCGTTFGIDWVLKKIEQPRVRVVPLEFVQHLL
jgi:hypothetical protein